MSTVIDMKALNQRVDGDRDLLSEIVELFLEQSPRAMSNIQIAIISQDTRMLEAAAHGLRGYLVSLHAERAAEIALQLELKGRLNDCVGIRYIFSKLEEEISLLSSILKPFTRAEIKQP